MTDQLRSVEFVWDESDTPSGVGLMEVLMDKYHIPGEVWDWTIRCADGSETTSLRNGQLYKFVRIMRDPRKEEKRRIRKGTG